MVEDSGPLAYIKDTARVEHSFRLAEGMALAGLLPDHLLRNKHGEFTASQVKGNCFRIVMQAMRWEVDPFALIDETFVVGGKIGYSGKLVLAMINARAKLKSRLRYTFAGEKGKSDLTVTVTGTFQGEEEASGVSLSVAEAKTENQMWNKDPEQKLIYSAVVRWARRYCPELILGIVTDDDAERMELWASQATRPPSKAPKPAFEKQAEATEVVS